jgi:hypothetical protein
MSSNSFVSKNKKSIGSHLFVISAALISFSIIVLLNQFVFPYYSSNHDEGVYIFQMKMLAQGDIYLKSNNYSDFFNAYFVINDGEKLYGKYTPVHPLILSIFYILFGDVRLAIGFLAALNIILLYFISMEIYDSDTAKIATIICLSSPLFLIISSTYLPYTTSLLLSQIFIYFVIKSLKNDSQKYPLVAGVALGILFFTRPYDALLMGAPFILYIIYKIITGEGRQTFTVKLVFLLAFFLPVFLITLIYNYILTDSPFLFPFNKYGPLDTLGFGIKRMSIYTPLYLFTINTSINATAITVYNLLFNWTLTGPFIIGFITLLILRTKRTIFDGLFLALLASVILGNFFFWGISTFIQWENGMGQFGPVYYYILILPLSLISGRYIFYISDSTKVKSLILVVFILINILFSMPKIELNYRYTEKNEKMYAPIIKGNITNALIFLPTPYGPFIHHPFGYLINDPSFNGSVIYAQNQGNKNIKLIKAYNNRDYYSYEYDGIYTESYKDNLTSRLIKLNLFEGNVITITAQIINPTNKKFVSSYIWNNGSIKSYLLDNNSQKDKTYNITWYLKSNEAVLAGDYLQTEGNLSKFKNNTPLTLASAFSDSPKSEIKEIYEYRYAFDINEEKIIILSPGESWQNNNFPQNYWAKTNITKVFSSRIEIPVGN